ncbi:MAG: Outer membrane efflux protein BepC precursor [Syntrophorhabdus sp. PtaB.Bin047]|nr:MAG: Outer membrane efflux protein BepC precursor [Syntrophorhabdus sp. PtaB.Bin047]
MTWIARLFIVSALAAVVLVPGTTMAQESFTLPSLLAYAAKHNPALRMAQRNVEIEGEGIRAAQADRMPRIDLTGGYTRYRYPAPLTPIVITSLPMLASDLPDFEKNVYDGFATFSVPLFKGGRLMRGVAIAELKRSMARDFHTRNLHELIYNVTAVYYKLAQLHELLRASEAQVKGLESHRRDVELALKAGTAPKLDLLKADTELGAAIERKIQTRNAITNTRELLKTLIGMDDPGDPIIVFDDSPPPGGSVAKADLEGALAARPDYRAAQSKVKMLEERVASAQGKRLPDIYGAGDYGGKAGDRMSFRENWSVGVRLFLPIFDFGRIGAEIDRERLELMKAKEEQRALRLTIARELKEAETSILDADERIAVSEKAVLSAKEQVRVEDLRYRSGDNTSTDVINAETALIRSRADLFQARFDRRVAVASISKAMGTMDLPTQAQAGGKGPGAGGGAPGRPMTEEVK